MKTYPISEILSYAQSHSEYYKNAWKQSERLELSELPVTNQEEFWSSKILTSSEPSGIVFKSGGSSGAPKYSYFTHEEWVTFTKCFGAGMSQGILESGDRIGNLFYVGDLYASFLFIKDSLQWIDEKKISQYPIAGSTSLDSILATCEEFNINVLCGVPSQLLKILEYLFDHKEKYQKIKIEKILFGGESLYADQEETIKSFFPQIKIASIGYASVDGGLLGYSSRDCENGEHRTFDGATIIEIVDPDTHEVINEVNRVGKVLLTNLTRKLMPIIRYPAGDLACWLEKSGTTDRKFKLQGRSDEAARLGTISVYFEDTRKMVLDVLKDYQGIQFQMILEHFDHKDQLTLRISAHELIPSDHLNVRLISAFADEKKVYKDVLAKKLIHPLKIEFVALDGLVSNVRTGKLKRVIDLRA
jgi:phenylacetate-CoA ligase